tara:strand:- start:796 stop:972 length:177 start_codon:yes stop_codon:yes gene_type:complete
MSLIKQHLYNEELRQEMRQDYFFMLNDIADEQEKVMQEFMKEEDSFSSAPSSPSPLQN